MISRIRPGRAEHHGDMRSERQGLVDSVRYEDESTLVFLPDPD
jgi:hypothetical protein